MDTHRIPRKVALALRAITQVEEPDQTPVAVPEGHGVPLSLEERLRMFVRHELSQAAREEGAGTFEEESDLDFDDEDELLSGHQVHDMAEEYLAMTEREERSGSDASEAPEAPEPAEPAQAGGAPHGDGEAPENVAPPPGG